MDAINSTKKRTKNKDKIIPQIRICKHKKKLRKSQQKKLRRLEEEKEKEQLLAESLRTLEKHSIRDNAHSFLLSSEKIGQRETTREKRTREIQLSKAGLLVPQCDKRPKKNIVDSCENETDVNENYPSTLDDKNFIMQPMLIESILAHSVSSQRLHRQSRIDSLLCGTEPIGLIKEASSDDGCPTVKLDVPSASIFTPHDNDSNPTVEVDQVCDLKVDTPEGTKRVRSDPLQRSSGPPALINVSRPQDVVTGRAELPIIMMEQEIMEAINSHMSVIICGETGCGKTTQIPQFLYEAGYGSKECYSRSGIIGVTQPRRVAVQSTARRVAYELGVRLGKEVGFQVRYDNKIGKNSSIMFMTDGILLREWQCDHLLKRYSVIVLDEAHERSLNTDILIGMLSLTIKWRQMTYDDQRKRQQSKMGAGEEVDPKSILYPLKLILMSATLQVEDFTSGNKIFSETPPVIEIPTRQFPITRHFSKKTVLEDYIGEAYKMVLKIHKRLPPGGILVFVTGQREVEDLCSKLRQASRQFSVETTTNLGQIDGHDIIDTDESLDAQLNRFSWYDECHYGMDDHESYLFDSTRLESDSQLESNNESDESDSDFVMDDEKTLGNLNLNNLEAAFEALVGVPEDTSTKSYGNVNEELGEKRSNVGPLHVLPLYAMLPSMAQLRVFKEVKEGERLVVVATNVAETSITIPGIKYVVDTGREKVKLQNSSNGMESYEIRWISRASGAQRAGRAGRTGPGHCYCLYSGAALTNEFPDFSCAEILRTPLDGVILLIKSIGYDVVTKFPFPTLPHAADLVEGEKCLKTLEALDGDGNLTCLGKAMSKYPMEPRVSKLLLSAITIIKNNITKERQNLVLGYVVAVAAALSLSNPFVSEYGANYNTSPTENGEDKTLKSKLSRKQIKHNREKVYHSKSDALSVAYALQCFDQSEDPSLFCNNYALCCKTMDEMSKLRKLMLKVIFNQRYKSDDLNKAFSWTQGTIQDVEYYWTTSSKNTLLDIEEDFVCEAICAGWSDRVAKKIQSKFISEVDRKAVQYQALMVEETVFLRRWSTISDSAPTFLVYHEMQHIKRPYIHGATMVKAEWLAKYARSLCTYSSPLADMDPYYDPYSDQVFCYVIPYFGPHLWVLPCCKVPIKDVNHRVAAFAYSLLDGQVLPCLKLEKRCMSAQPRTIFDPKSCCQERVHYLLHTLNARKIDSCRKLREVWKQNPLVLYSEIKAWFQKASHDEFPELWTKMHHEAYFAPEDRFNG